MPKFTIYATYTYAVHDVEAPSYDAAYRLVSDGELDVREEAEWGPDVDIDVEMTSE